MVLAVLAVGCSGGTTDGGEGSRATSTPVTASATTSVPIATTQTSVAAGQPYRLWFLRDGRLSPGEARVASGPDGPREALEQLIAGRTPGEEALGLQTGVQSNVEILSWQQEGTTVVVGFNRAFETAQTRPQVAQVVWTLTQFSGIDAVRFLIDGRPNGATGVPAIGRADLDDIWAPVMVDTPLPGASVGPGTVELTGTVQAGAQASWRLEDGFGSTVAQGPVVDLAPSPGVDGRIAWRAGIDLPGGLAGPARLVVAEASTPGVEGFPQVVPLTILP